MDFLVIGEDMDLIVFLGVEIIYLGAGRSNGDFAASCG